MSDANYNEIRAQTGLPRFDPEKYMPHLDGADLNQAQKHDLLRALWDLMVAFADQAFGLDATQLACGKLAGNADPRTLQHRSMVELTDKFQSLNKQKGGL